MEKAIEIKRRAQRFVQSGDVDAALVEYEKLARAEENEPYHSVVIADLLFKKGDPSGASARYLSAIDGYEAAGLYKNGIAVCKKMARLSLAPGQVFQRLGQLHQRDGLTTESALYFMQHAEYALRMNDLAAAAASFRLAFEASPENVVALERLAELHLSNGEDDPYSATLTEAAAAYDRLGHLADAKRLRARLGGNAHEPAPAPVEARLETASTIEAVRDVLPEGTEPLRAPRFALRPAAVPPAEGLVSAARHLRDPGEPRTPALDDPNERVITDVAPVGIEPAGLGDPAAGGDLITDEAERSANAASAVAADSPDRIHTGSGYESPAAEPARATGTNGKAVAGQPAQAESARAAERPGLRFELDGADAATDPVDPYAHIATEAVLTPEVSTLIEQGREQARGGQLDAAAQSFTRAAQAWDTAGKSESAAGVYRALHANLPPVRPALMLWFDNCRRRGDRGEAARVALGLGEEAQSRADTRAAREWFERAFVLDPSNVAAAERLRTLTPDTPQEAVPAAETRTAPRVPGPANGAGAAPAPFAPTPFTPVPPAPAPGMPLAPPMLKPVPQPAGARNRAQSPVAEGAPRIEVTHGYGDEVHMELDQLLDTFRKEIQHQVSGDPQSNYALGVSYLEMGLSEEAIESLRAAGEDPSLKASATELIGRCLMDNGRFEDAATEFRAALDHPAVTGEPALGLRFELGLALEAAGRLDDALMQFERLYAAQPSYPDVAMKIRLLRKMLENE